MTDLNNRVMASYSPVHRRADDAEWDKLLALLEKLPKWARIKANSCPRRPRKGIHPWLFFTARRLHRYLSEDEVCAVLWAKSRHAGRHVGDKEIRSQVKSAQHWLPPERGHSRD
jgi:hypothetical protein